MKYLPLFTLEIFHEYYADRRCSDFEIEVPPTTQKLLADCRCVLKPLPNGLRVLISATDQTTPFIPLPDKATFGFLLRLQNPNFALFTDLSTISSLAAPLYTNNGTTPELALTSRQTNQIERFTVRKPAKTDDFTLSGRPLKGLGLAGFQVNGLGSSAKPVSYDETGKVLRVNSSNAKAGDSFTVTYPTTPTLPLGVFAALEITPTGLSGGVNPFQIAFKAKKVRWKYYVITSKSENVANLPGIEDKDKLIAFDAAGRTNLTQTPDPADQVATDLAGKYPNTQTYRLASNTLVPCQETARKTIQLKIDGEKVMDALPNPAIQNYSIEPNKEDSLYQIVKYFK